MAFSVLKAKKLLNPVHPTKPEDDFRILDSWIDINGDRKDGTVDYYCYKIETVNPETGKRNTLYKAVKFARVVRLPKSAKQSTSFMDMQTQVLSAAYEQGYNLVTMIANVIRPRPEGLMYLYGLQGVSDTIEEAKKRASLDFNGFVRSMMGTFRTLHIRDITAEEGAWLSEKMRGMKFMTAVRGIPKANTAGEDMGNKGVGGANVNPDSQGTLEEIITALADFEYCIEVLSTPVYERTLQAWSAQTQKQMTEWNGQLQGTKSLSFNLSIPMTYMTSTGSSSGWSKNYTDSSTISYTQGESYNTGYSESVGQSLSQSFGESLGISKGTSITDSTGTSHTVSTGTSRTEGITESQGLTTGQSVTVTNGVTRGQTVGNTVSNSTSISNSSSLGSTSGNTIGNTLGQTYGTTSGNTTGSTLGTTSGNTSGTTTGITNGTTTGVTNGTTNGTTNGITNGTTTGTTNGTTNGVTNGTTVGNTSGLSTGTSSSQSSSVSSGSSTGTSNSVSYGKSESSSTTQSLSNSVSSGTSSSTSQSQSTGSTYGQSISSSASQSYGNSSSESHSVGTSNSTSVGTSTSVSTGGSHSSGGSSSTGTSNSESVGANVGSSNSVGFNGSNSASNSDGTTKTNSGNASFSAAGFNFGGGTQSGTTNTQSNSTTSGLSINGGSTSGISYSESSGTTSSNGKTWSDSDTWSESAGTTTSTSNGLTESYSAGTGSSYSETYGASYGTSSSQSVSNSTGVTNGVSSTIGASVSNGTSQSTGTTSSASTGTTSSLSNSVSNGLTTGTSATQSASQSLSNSQSTSASQSVSTSASQSASTSASQSASTSASQSASTSASQSASTSASQSLSSSASQSTSQSLSDSQSSSSSDSVSISVSQNSSNSTSYGTTQGYSTSTSESLSNSYSQSQGESTSSSYSQSTSTSVGTSASESDGTSTSRSVGESESESYTQSVTNGVGQNWSQSTSLSQGSSNSTSEGTSTGTSVGSTGTYTTGSSGSFGLGPSIGFNKSYQWLDQQVKDILELLEYQNERIKKALRGNGAFYTYVYIACPNMEALVTAQAAAKSTWQNEYAMTQPVQVLDLADDEQQHLLYHFRAFSADVTRENVAGISDYKYATVLLANEYVAYTHLPRISEGGIDTNIDDIPKFRVPGLMRGDIYMGTQLNAERYTFNNGYRTQFDYRINIDELMHAVFTGASRSGKTVAAMRFVRELANARRSATNKRLRIVIMDPKQDWRGIARFVEPERFRFYSMGNTHFRPINMNPCKIPLGVEPQHWIDGLINIYCRAYGLLERGKQMMSDVFYDLYKDAGIFDESEAKKYGGADDMRWKEEVSRRSGSVTFHKVYKKMDQKRVELTAGGKKAGNDTMDAYARLLERLSCFNRPFSIEYRLFSAEDNFDDPNSVGLGMGVDELIGDDDITVFESFGLESTFANFIFGIITSGFYKVAKSYEKGFLHPSQYETVLVIEEANKVLTGNDTAGTGGGGGMASLSGQSEFEEILDQSAGYGLFIVAITQKISMMPSSIVANCGMFFLGKISHPDDVNLAVRMIGREERIDDRDVVKWLPKSPTGWFICRSNRGYDFRDAEPVLVQIEALNNASISNAELDEILVKKELALAMEEAV